MSNDTLSPENGVTYNVGEANDTREQLEVDVRNFINATVYINDELKVEFIFVSVDTVLDWLDRQGAITERECRDYENELRKQHHKRIGELKAKVDELTEERDELLEQVQKYAEAAASFEQFLADVERTHMRLPVDADGVLIRVGEMIKEGNWQSTVIAVSESGWAGYDGMYHDAATSCHPKPENIEDIIKELMLFDATDYYITKPDVTEYATRIRKAVEQ